MTPLVGWPLLIHFYFVLPPEHSNPSSSHLTAFQKLASPTSAGIVGLCRGGGSDFANACLVFAP